MQSNEHERPTSSLVLGVVLVVVASSTLYFAKDIELLRASDNSDPGPRAFPTLLSGLLMAAGIYEAVSWFVRRTNDSGEPDKRTAKGIVNLMLACISLVGYAYVLPHVGFATASIVFSFAWMIRFGSGWLMSGLFTVLLVIAIEVLFREFFKVQLPEGSTVLSIDQLIINR